MHADNRGVDHLSRGVMDASESVHDLGPDTSTPPANEAIVTGGVGAEAAGQIAPWRQIARAQKMPLRTRRSFTRGTLRGLFGSIGLMAVAGAYTSSSETQNLTEEGASAEPLSIGRHRQNVAICRNESGVGAGPILTSVGVLGGRLCADATDTTARTAASHPL